MFSLQKWKCSWSLAATIAAILALASVVHLFLYPLVSPLDYLSLSKTQNSCLPENGSTEGSQKKISEIGAEKGKTDSSNKNPQPVVDLSVQYPADLHYGVTYRGAPWMAEIGRWLSGCDSNTTAVKIVEVNNCFNPSPFWLIIVNLFLTVSLMVLSGSFLFYM